MLQLAFLDALESSLQGASRRTAVSMCKGGGAPLEDGVYEALCSGLAQCLWEKAAVGLSLATRELANFAEDGV